MSHMIPDITSERTTFAICEDGTVLPESHTDTLPDDVDVLDRREGWGVRLTAPGYYDSTAWRICDTIADAVRELWNLIDRKEPEHVDGVRRIVSMYLEGTDLEVMRGKFLPSIDRGEDYSVTAVMDRYVGQDGSRYVREIYKFEKRASIEACTLASKRKE